MRFFATLCLSFVATTAWAQDFGADPSLGVVANEAVALCFKGQSGDFVVVKRDEKTAVQPAVPAAVLACVTAATPEQDFWAMSVRVSPAGYGAVPKIVGVLDPIHVRKVYARSTVVSDCQLEVFRRTKTVAEGVAVIRLKVVDGVVKQAYLIGSHFTDKAFEACYVKGLQTLLFDTTPGETHISLPLTLRISKTY